jgi:CRP/FNR family transcriptional regulator, anaerobic regulatory protein
LNAQTPTTEGIQALTAAELLVISKKDLEMLYQKVPAMQEVGRKATENVVAAMSNRISILINQSAEKRYDTIMERHPILIQTVPLQYLASYLGITPQHLSRIRKKSSQSLS